LWTRFLRPDGADPEVLLHVRQPDRGVAAVDEHGAPHDQLEDLSVGDGIVEDVACYQSTL
jgi:hypothetical protein